jgi:myosin heavy subunit
VRPDEVIKGGCYYLPHPQKVWITVMVLETPADTHSCRVRLLDDGTELSINLHECTLTPMQAHGRQGESNLAKLDAEAMHEPELLTILDSRSKIEAQQPYTAVGDCLLVVNPLRVLQIDPAMKDVAAVHLQPARALPPHPYVLAEEEYMKLKVPSLWPPTPAATAVTNSSSSSDNIGRCVVVAGTSGAGISHTAAHIVRYLGWRGTAGVDAHCTPAALTSSPPSPRGDSPAGGASTAAAGTAAAGGAAAGGFGLGSEHRRISALPPQRKSSVTAAAPAAAAAAALAAAAPVSVSACLAAVDTVLQAFLGAATPANHSSSRYGRVTKLQFEDVDSTSSSNSSNSNSSSGGRHKLCAASVQVFLPELSRLCAVSEGHRNFNVLYSLLAGADKELRRRITVLPLDYYGYLNQTSVGALDEVSVC